MLLEIVALAGAFLAFEGALYAGFPGFARSLAARVLEMSDDEMRRGGLVALVAGVVLVWLVRG